MPDVDVVLLEHAYGKALVRLVKVHRADDPHRIHDVTVDIELEGDFDAAYVEADNTLVVPTDTMKNTVYGLAVEHLADQIEPFAIALARHFVARHPQVDRATVAVTEHPWRRITVGGEAVPHAFRRDGSVIFTTDAVATHESVDVWSGIEGLTVLKTTGSAFAGYTVDEYTTLEPADDRVLATVIGASWKHATVDADFGRRDLVQSDLTDVFATHDDSKSVQHTLWEMGKVVLDRHPGIDEISISMPNKHHLPFDVERFGLSGHGVIFYPIDEPHGTIRGTIRRA